MNEDFEAYMARRTAFVMRKLEDPYVRAILERPLREGYWDLLKACWMREYWQKKVEELESGQ